MGIGDKMGDMVGKAKDKLTGAEDDTDEPGRSPREAGERGPEATRQAREAGERGPEATRQAREAESGAEEQVRDTAREAPDRGREHFDR